ncbi:M1 family aminopeptidase [soil metagenome]
MMRNTFSREIKAVLFLPLLFSFLSCSRPMQNESGPPVEAGVSALLAEHRRQVLRDIAYDLAFRIPGEREAPIPASETISFQLLENTVPLQLDFKEKREMLQQVTVNGRDIPVVHEQEHVLIAPEFLQSGRNTVALAFTAGNLSLNRNEEFLYTLLVPDRARTVFPCFDQPDLKATFRLSLTVPRGWQALANGPLRDSVMTEEAKTFHFLPSDTIPTYLFAFAAGKFTRVSEEAAGSPRHFFHRETDAAKLKESLGPIFRIHGEALRFMADFTQIPYPFRKFDFVAIPDFQYNGMEHVGAITYRASSLFLDEGATQDQKNNRSNLIAHETAHMWFGDLVTMRWFNDVWMKEVFANFMADKITQQAGVSSDFDLKFLVDHFPTAYSVDRTAGANPIRQPLDNLQDAGTLYGPIIYHKAPIVMRQLERLMGPEAFRQGLREYLRAFAYGNASWPDLIGVLDPHTSADLAAWSRVWVSEPGRPVFSQQLHTEGGRISGLELRHQGEDGSERVWPQGLEVALVYPDRTEELTVQVDGPQVRLAAAEGKPVPSYILFNSSGQGYGLFSVEEKMFAGLYALKDPVMRASGYISLYENMLAGRGVRPEQLLAFLRQGTSRETEELNLKLLTGQLGNLFWRFTSPGERERMAPALEKELWQAMQGQTAANNKKRLFKAYQQVALTQEAQGRLYGIWQAEKAPAGVKLTEDDYTSLALALAVRDHPDAEGILAQQLTRIPNPDRKNRLQFMLPALSGEEGRRDAFFALLLQQQHREKEAWVVMALEYLHHPLRAAASEKYLRASLDLLEEIQLTGDIFFPQNWLQATFGSYQSAGAARTIRDFLEEHPRYNPKLKAKILQAADGVFRAEKLTRAAP